jgi:hypothetical protein
MKYLQTKFNNKILLYSIILILVFFIIVLPCFDKLHYHDQKILNEDFDNLINAQTSDLTNEPTNTDNSDKLVLIDKNICSKACCKFTQWPVPFNTVPPNVSQEILDKFIGTNFTCNGGSDGGGCVCASKSDLNYLTNHGQQNKN